MSDTPRTNDQIGYAGSTMSAIRIEFCRKLERELNAANSEVERLTRKVAELYEGAEEQKQRIKRMEEAGDAMYRAWMHPFHFAKQTIGDNWRKAKEAKP